MIDTLIVAYLQRLKSQGFSLFLAQRKNLTQVNTISRTASYIDNPEFLSTLYFEERRCCNNETKGQFMF